MQLVRVVMSETTSQTPRPRVVQWLRALAEAGPDEARAASVLRRVRDDPAASPADHAHFRRALAQQSLVWFLGALEGRPLSRAELQEAAQLLSPSPK
ncbi:MAG: hypothetical protein ACO3JL_10225 [Myxococcota bacterium]